MMSPPIRSPEHQRRLKAALAGGALTMAFKYVFSNIAEVCCA